MAGVDLVVADLATADLVTADLVAVGPVLAFFDAGPAAPT